VRKRRLSSVISSSTFGQPVAAHRETALATAAWNSVSSCRSSSVCTGSKNFPIRSRHGRRDPDASFFSQYDLNPVKLRPLTSLMRRTGEGPYDTQHSDAEPRHVGLPRRRNGVSETAIVQSSSTCGKCRSSLPPSTRFASSQVVSRTFASFRVPRFGVSAAQRDFVPSSIPGSSTREGPGQEISGLGLLAFRPSIFGAG
jgi:hypothetical protein